MEGIVDAVIVDEPAFQTVPEAQGIKTPAALYTLIVEPTVATPCTDLLLAQTDALVMAAVQLDPETVEELQLAEETNSPEAVAVALIISPLIKDDKPEIDHVPAVTDAVPIKTPFLYKLIKVPGASVEVPEITVTPAVKLLVITGQVDRSKHPVPSGAQGP